MPAERMRAELSTSRQWLGEMLGRRIDSMSIPTGERTNTVVRAASDLGYRFVGNSVEEMNRPRGLPAEISGFVVLANHDAATICRIAAGHPAYIA
jgi:hypothetical protein